MILSCHHIARIVIFALCFIMIMYDLLYTSETHNKLFTLSNIFQMNAANRKQMNIPRNIIQTAKSILQPRFPSSFERLNPYHTYMFFTDAQAEEFVRQHMPPDIIHAYEIMPLPVLKADYFRYIAIYVLGGVYSDIDTECLRPIDKWADHHSNVSFIVGVEAEGPIWKTHVARPLQLCQWTFASMPKHPILKRMIDNIAKQTDKFIDGKLNISVVLDWTGPGLWTDTIFDYINETYHIDWWTLRKLQRGRVIGDIYLLPMPAFRPSGPERGAKGRRDPEARVWHYFHGSWKQFPSETAI
jgi:alpha 1,6-mannosyltransferase